MVITLMVLLVTGCVTPPTGTTTSSTSSGYYATETNTPETTAPSAYVTVVTPFTSSSSSDTEPHTSGFATYATPTPLPEDLSCLIYLKPQYYSYNTTAVTFDLKNPPMYINYTVVPFNITVNKVVASRTGTKSNDVQTFTFSDYAPYSWFDITVKNKTTGEIYLQDGFGREKGYGTYTSATLKPILKTDDLLIEMRGNNITATTGIWVKPLGNFDDPQNKSFTECKYWGQPRNFLPIAVVTATTTATWAPENQVKYT